MATLKYVNPSFTLELRADIAIGSTQFNEMIDRIIIEFSKKTTTYYCKKFHSIETRTSAKLPRHDDCQHQTKGDIIGNKFIIDFLKVIRTIKDGNNQ